MISFRSGLLILAALSIALIGSSDQAAIDKDDMCEIQKSVLCVKEVLDNISKGAEKVSRQLKDIELHIKNTKMIDALNRLIEQELNYTRHTLPATDYHDQFSEKNNIDQQYLIDIVLEAQNALIFFYNSIDRLAKHHNDMTATTDGWFKDVQRNLRHDMICRYQSVLRVFYKNRPLKHQIHSIEFSRRDPERSFVHEVQSVVIAQNLYNWMERIKRVIHDLELKYF